MTTLLKEAFKKASALPNDEQNEFARWMLEELESEKKWDRVFAASEDVLGKLADEVLGEHRDGKTKKLDIDTL